jgi:hypothetical protein
MSTPGGIRVNIKLLKNYTYYSIEKIMEDSEDPRAKIGI